MTPESKSGCRPEILLVGTTGQLRKTLAHLGRVIATGHAELDPDMNPAQRPGFIFSAWDRSLVRVMEIVAKESV
jgi:hypothetical protein